jgi:hypothetical protein
VNGTGNVPPSYAGRKYEDTVLIGPLIYSKTWWKHASTELQFLSDLSTVAQPCSGLNMRFLRGIVGAAA